MRCSRLSPLFFAAALPGCYQGLDASGSDADSAAPTDDTADDDAADDGSGSGGEIDESPSVGGYHLMRLTRAEYDNTVRDLLGDASAPSSTFAEDEKVGPFDANVLAPPSEVMLQDYMDAAETLAATAVQDVAGLTGCTDDLGTDDCARSFVAAFARRGYRRAPTSAESDRLFAVFTRGRELRGFDHGIELVVRAVLQSPHFLYRVERGEPVPEAPGVLGLTADEIATRLSYFILDSMPDDELFAAVDAGALTTTEDIEAQARRLLATDAAAPMIAAFHTQWLGLGPTLAKDPLAFPEYDEALMQSMRREVALFASDVVLDGDGQLATLLSSPHTFVDAPLAALYGVEHPSADPQEFVRVDLDPSQRAGLFTQIGVLAAKSHPDHTSPVLRGRFLRAFVLCQPPPPPPPDVNNTPPVFDPDRSQREQLDELMGVKPCIDCHQLMNPLGFALDNFDAIGRWRTELDGFPIDASGMLIATDVDGAFAGPVELAQRLAASEDVAECVARQWFRFALGRVEDNQLDEGSLAVLSDAVATGDIRELIVAITQTEAFRYRPIPVDASTGGEQR